MADTTGTNGPARIRSKSTTQFVARKEVRLSEEGVESSPTEVESDAEITGQTVTTNSSGLRGRLMQSVAEQRVAEKRPASEKHTAQIVAERVQRNLDADTEARLEQLRERVIAPLEQLAGEPICVKFSSTADCLRICVYEKSATTLVPPQWPVADRIAMGGRETLAQEQVETAITQALDLGGNEATRVAAGSQRDETKTAQRTAASVQR